MCICVPEVPLLHNLQHLLINISSGCRPRRARARERAYFTTLLSSSQQMRITHGGVRVTAFPAIHQLCFFVAQCFATSINFSIPLDLRRAVFHPRTFCLSIPTVQYDLDASIICIDGTEQTTVDKLSPSCYAVTHLLSSGMAVLP